MDVPTRDQTTHIDSCAECGAALAHDQRYCLECGVRRGPLPHHISQVIAGIMERGRQIASPGRPDAEPPVPAASERGPFDAWIVAPRAAAAAVIGTLGFGVVAGSLVGGSVASALRPLLVVVSPASSPRVANASLSSSGSGASNASGGSATVTITSAAGSAPSQQPAGSSQTGSSGGSTTAGSPTPSTLPPVKHVFMIVLSNQGYGQTFGNIADDPYLAKTLAHEGELIPTYYGVAGSPLANEIALISGQGPTPQTAADCSAYRNIVPAKKGARGQVLGKGCVYPKKTETIADQLTSHQLTWKAYVQIGSKPKRARKEMCQPRLGSSGPSASDSPGPYAAWRNPFLYFHSVTGAGACPKSDVALTQLSKDLKSASSTPSLSYIVADACDDGSDAPCTLHAKAGLGPAERFLRSVVPEIKRSPAYKAGGLIVITFDEAPQVGPNADPAAAATTRRIRISDTQAAPRRPPPRRRRLRRPPPRRAPQLRRLR